MKIIPAPQINGLDELLDVILHPEKLVQTLQSLKDMRDQVTANLELYTTKGKAEDYLVQAQSANNLAEASLAEAKQVVVRAQEKAERETDALNEQKAKLLSIEQVQGQKARDLRFLEQSLDERGRALATRADQLDAREAALTEATAALVRKQTMLDAEVKKMSDRIAAFHAVN